MKKDKPLVPDKAKRRLKIAVATMFLLTFGVFGATLYLQNRSATAQQSNFVVPQQDPKTIKALQNARVAQAQELREKWRLWALNHKQVLQRLTKADPKDEAALMAVWNALPSDPESPATGIATTDLMSGVAQFSWQPGLLPVRADVANKAKDEKSNRLLMEQVREDFAEHQDIMLGDASEVGPQGVSFWASGRVTTWTYTPQPRVPGEPTAKIVHRDVLPSYDFLR